MQLEQFVASLGGMTPQQLKDTVQSLALARTEASGAYAGALSKAKASGLAEDVDAAKAAGT